jgi:hypothetical protein
VRALDLDRRAETGDGSAAPARRRRDRLAEVGVYAGYLALAVLVLIRLWLDPNGRVLAGNADDHGFFMFTLAHGERVLFHGANPLFSDRLNVPDGVNMMANTSVLAVSLPAAPITHFFGTAVAIVLLLTLGLAGTAAAWYRVLSRHLVDSRAAAWIGGLWCGFCPAIVSHANGQINFVAQFVLPFIVWQVLRLREPGRVSRGGIVLGLLLVLQVFINEETLLFTALTLGVFVLAYAAMAWRATVEVAGRVAAGLGVAAAVAGVLLAYPLWFQFAGPGSYRGQPFTPDVYVTDLYSMGAYARQSLLGDTETARRLSASATEENTFFGVPVLIMLVVALCLVWRSVAARATAVAGLVLLVMSFGPRLRVDGRTTGVPLPFGLVSHLPLIDLVSVTRFAMVAATVTGVLLALAADRVAGKSRVLFWAGLVLALVPVLPKPLPVVADPVPPFIASGMWRGYLPADRSLVTVPLPEANTGRAGMRWAAMSGFGFGVPRGYFMGPANPPADLTGSWAAVHRVTSQTLYQVGKTGVRPVLTAADRQAFTADLAYWRAGVVVLVPDAPHGGVLRDTLVDLFQRAPERAGGVELWRIPSAG